MKRTDKTYWWMFALVWTTIFIVALLCGIIAHKPVPWWKPAILGVLVAVFIHLVIGTIRSLAQLLHEDRLKREIDAGFARMGNSLHKYF